MKLAITVAIGCGSAPVVSPVAPKQPVAATTYVSPGELVLSREAERLAVLRRQARAWLRAGDDRSLVENRQGTDLEFPSRVEVIGESRDRLEIATYAQGAELALWIDRADAMPVVTSEAKLVKADGSSVADVGVWVEPGVPVYANRRLPDRVEVILGDRFQFAVWVYGWLPTGALGTVWKPAPDAAPRGTVKTQRLPRGTRVIAAPDDPSQTALLAELLEDHDVSIVRAAGAWSVIELRSPQVRVRGFVPSAAIEPVFVDHGTTSRDLLGAEPEYRVNRPGAVPLTLDVGTCLYAELDHAPIGVQGSDRATVGSDLGAGWWHVDVATDWGTVAAAVHELPSATHRWERCPATR